MSKQTIDSGKGNKERDPDLAIADTLCLSLFNLKILQKEDFHCEIPQPAGGADHHLRRCSGGPSLHVPEGGRGLTPGLPTPAAQVSWP